MSGRRGRRRRTPPPLPGPNDIEGWVNHILEFRPRTELQLTRILHREARQHVDAHVYNNIRARVHQRWRHQAVIAAHANIENNLFQNLAFNEADQALVEEGELAHTVPANIPANPNLAYRRRQPGLEINVHTTTPRGAGNSRTFEAIIRQMRQYDQEYNDLSVLANLTILMRAVALHAGIDDDQRVIVRGIFRPGRGMDRGNRAFRNNPPQVVSLPAHLWRNLEPHHLLDLIGAVLISDAEANIFDFVWVFQVFDHPDNLRRTLRPVSRRGRGLRGRGLRGGATPHEHLPEHLRGLRGLFVPGHLDDPNDGYCGARALILGILDPKHRKLLCRQRKKETLAHQARALTRTLLGDGYSDPSLPFSAFGKWVRMIQPEYRVVMINPWGGVITDGLFEGPEFRATTCADPKRMRRYSIYILYDNYAGTKDPGHYTLIGQINGLTRSLSDNGDYRWCDGCLSDYRGSRIYRHDCVLHRCDKCITFFDTSSALRHHQTVPEHRKTLVCPKCQRPDFPTTDCLSRHQTRCNGRTPVCGACNQPLIANEVSESGALYHLCRHKKCPVCYRFFATEEHHRCFMQLRTLPSRAAPVERSLPENDPALSEEEEEEEMDVPDVVEPLGYPDADEREEDSAPQSGTNHYVFDFESMLVHNQRELISDDLPIPAFHITQRHKVNFVAVRRLFTRESWYVLEKSLCGLRFF